MNFFEKYFLQPFYADAGYNIVNTTVYALIAIAALYGVYRGLRKLQIDFDLKFFIGLIPFIGLGAIIRAFVDHSFIDYTFWTVSPGIYFTILLIFLACLIPSYLLQHKFKLAYWKTLAAFGASTLCAVIIFFGRFELSNLWAAGAVLGLASSFSITLYAIFKLLKWKYGLGVGFLPFPAHMLDASATFIAVQFFGAWEKHPLTRFFTELSHTPAIFYVLKLLVLIPLVYLLQKELDRNLANYFLIAIAVLGFAEGLRDLLTLIL